MNGSVMTNIGNMTNANIGNMRNDGDVPNIPAALGSIVVGALGSRDFDFGAPVSRFVGTFLPNVGNFGRRAQAVISTLSNVSCGNESPECCKGGVNGEYTVTLRAKDGARCLDDSSVRVFWYNPAHLLDRILAAEDVESNDEETCYGVGRDGNQATMEVRSNFRIKPGSPSETAIKNFFSDPHFSVEGSDCVLLNEDLLPQSGGGSEAPLTDTEDASLVGFMIAGGVVFGLCAVGVGAVIKSSKCKEKPPVINGTVCEEFDPVVAVPISSQDDSPQVEASAPPAELLDLEDHGLDSKGVVSSEYNV